jgi:hypothetical protein
MWGTVGPEYKIARARVQTIRVEQFSRREFISLRNTAANAPVLREDLPCLTTEPHDQRLLAMLTAARTQVAGEPHHAVRPFGERWRTRDHSAAAINRDIITFDVLGDARMDKTCYTIFIASAASLGAIFAPPACAAGVTLADLEGAVIETSVVYDRTVRLRDQGVIPSRLQHDRKITIGPGGNLHNTLVHTISTPRGPVVRQESGSVTIGKAKQIQTLGGGGDAVWIFENGTLTLLRTYRSGAYKMEIVFTRSATGISCKARAPWARENGTGSIEMASAGDGKNFEVISARQISSSCRVTKR